MVLKLVIFSRSFGIAAPVESQRARIAFATMLIACAGVPVLAQNQSDGRQPSGGVDLKEGPALFSRGGAGSAGEPGTAANAQHQTWTVVLAAFRGTDHGKLAEEALPKLRGVPGLEESFISPRGDATFIGIGRFVEASDEQAQKLLEKVRGLTVDGAKLFAQAFLAPPEAGVLTGSRPEFNLVSAKKQFGKSARMTLQVGVYGRDDLAKPTEKDMAEVRKLAEQAVLQLRREGQLAFYYHSPRRSMVTVGVFSDADVKPNESAEIKKLRKIFPHNLYNGQGIREKVTGLGDLGIQKSFLVEIPER